MNLLHESTIADEDDNDNNTRQLLLAEREREWNEGKQVGTKQKLPNDSGKRAK